MKELFKSFQSSLQRLEEVLQEEETGITRDAAIQRFKFTVELGWKTIQKFLREQKLICRSPKECLKAAFDFGLIQDDPLWLQMMDDRNLTVHTYQESTAQAIYHRLPTHLNKLKELFSALQNRLEV